MDAIKKKMQAMKIEKDNAMDRADAAEEKVRQANEKLERLEEELRDTQKKMIQTENDLDKAQEDLTAANTKLEEKEKIVVEVRAQFTSRYPGPPRRDARASRTPRTRLVCTVNMARGERALRDRLAWGGSG
jgi:predicted  nucleic acid-binding Zn-ribbon protein